MRTLACIVMAAALLTGCASFEEAYYIDREYGQAQMAAWDKQVAYPDYRHVAKTPESIEGVTAEEIMSIYNQTFAEEPEQIEVFQLGIEQ